MDPAFLSLGREAMILVLLLSAPPLVAAMVVGLAAGVLQAATQVQEQTLGVVPRIAAVLVALAVAAPWLGARMARFGQACLELLPRIAP